MSSSNTSTSSFEHFSDTFEAPTKQDTDAEPFITGLHHVNLLVPPQTLPLAYSFYAGLLGLRPAQVPASCKSYLAWFDIGNSGQQIHISSQHHLTQAQLRAQSESARHPCFKIGCEENLDAMQRKIWELYEKGGEGAPMYCDQPQKKHVVESVAGGFPIRFFARDYAGNRLEFSL